LILSLTLTAMFVNLPVWAHAILVDSTPPPRGVVQGPKVTIRLRFNSRIDGAHSRLYVNTPSGARQIKTDSQTAPDTLSGIATDLKPGEYQLRWQVLAVDGHITRGEVPFTVL
jgi:copper resistance protein C